MGSEMCIRDRYSGDGVELDRDIDRDHIVAWRDATTVVVEDGTTDTVRYVDVTSGRTLGSQKLEVTGHGGSRVMSMPTFAADLWTNSLVSGVRPPDYGDPRVSVSTLLRVVGPALALGLVGAVLWRRRVRP